MKEDEDIETMFSRFQILVSGLHVVNKSYTMFDHDKKILRSLLFIYRPKVTTIQEAKDLNKLSLESLISNLQSNEMKLNGYEPIIKSMPLALKSVSKYSKASQVRESEEVSHVKDSEGDSDDEEMTFIIKRFQYLAKNNKRLSSISSGIR